jgi:beta-galactosidase
MATVKATIGRPAALWLLLAAGALPAAPAAAQRTTTSLDPGWRFRRGEAVGAEQRGFDDAAWQAVDVPHDWSIEGPYDRAAPSGRGGGYLPSGVSWYRRRFPLPAAEKGRRVAIELDGVMADGRVWLNGRYVGHRPNGYVGVRYDVTEYARFGDGDAGANVLSIRTDTTLQPASRWYTGQGVYRHVRLVTTDPVHVAPRGLYVTTPDASVQRATVHVRTTVQNESRDAREVAVRVTITGPDGLEVAALLSPARTIDAGGGGAFQTEVPVPRARQWDLDHPDLYRATVTVLADGRPVDETGSTFGFREARFEPASGFWLNGQNLKLKGVCLHHDGGAVGAAVPLGVWERRLLRLKALGVNAVRTAHNPPDPGFLDLTDRLGLLVMDEVWDAWTVGKNHANYGVHLLFPEWWEADTRDTVQRDRNHPSVVLWSAGNEIHDTPYPERAKRILKGLLDVFHGHDPSRPVTQGLFRPNVSKDYDNGLADMLDVIGQNYREKELVAAHEQKPTRRVIGTENRHDREVWLALRDHAFIAGQFLWPGIDYLGEEDWPRTTFVRGLLDRTGEPRAAGWERASWWSDTPVVRAFRRLAPPPRPEVDPGYDPQAPPPPPPAPILREDWTPDDARTHDEEVEVYSNADEVELVLNGRSVGTLAKNADASPRIFRVAYERGTLAAIARDRGREVARHELRTAGRAARVELTLEERAVTTSFEDVVHATARIVDADGVPVPDADHAVSFAVEGPGRVIAVDDGDPESHEPYVATSRTAFRGRVLAILRATGAGRVTVTATAKGLAPGASAFDATAVP